MLLRSIIIHADGPPLPRYAEALYESSRIKSEFVPIVERWIAVLRPCEQTTNLIINFANEDWILDDDSVTLASVGMGQSHGSTSTRLQSDDPATENEAEVSFFSRELYEAFKLDPTTNW